MIEVKYNDNTKQWEAWDENEVDYDWDGESYCCLFDIGRGETEIEAITDLLKQKIETITILKRK
jgi:hypothetical protein